MEKQPELELSGAASALKYLEMSVTRAQERLDAAHEAFDYALKCQGDKPAEMDGEDFEVLLARARAEVNDAETSLLRFSKTMLDYDKNVDTSRRDVSETITKADAVRWFKAFAICMRGGVEQAITRISQDAMELRSPEDVYKIIGPMNRECFSSAMSSACSEEQVPSWVGDAVNEAL